MNDEFETAVTRTLADMARVDAATFAETRASIARLPDRRSAGFDRFGMRRPHLTLGLSPVFSLAAVGAIVIALVAVSVFARYQGTPAASGSATPLAGSPSPTAPTTTPTAPTTTPTAPSTPALAANCVVPYWNTSTPPQGHQFASSNRSLGMLGWSPDGSSFAMIEAPNSISPTEAPTATIDLFSRTGADEGTIEGWLFGWLDATDFVVFRAGPPVSGGYLGRAFIGRIGSTDLTPLPGTYNDLLTGPRGGVALLLPWNGTLASPPQYVVVSDGKVSAPRTGHPAAWSPDGSALAVFHPTKLYPRSEGSDPNAPGPSSSWLEIVRSTGESILSARDVDTRVWGGKFSPDGKRLAFDDNLPNSTPSIQVLDVSSGRLSTITDTGGGWYTWAGNEELLTGSYVNVGTGPTTVWSWSAPSGALTRYAASGIQAIASSAGLVAVRSDCLSQFQVAQRANGQVSVLGTLDLGSSSWSFLDSSWSPDGRSLVVIVLESNPASAATGNLAYAHATLISF